MGQWRNCWEFKKCGRNPGGSVTGELGVCPAATDVAAHSLNHGIDGGRICWAITGTICDGAIQGEFARKQLNCINCDFYKLVHAEEGPHIAYLPDFVD